MTAIIVNYFFDTSHYNFQKNTSINLFRGKHLCFGNVKFMGTVIFKYMNFLLEFSKNSLLKERKAILQLFPVEIIKVKSS